MNNEKLKLEEELRTAALYGNAKKVEELLEQGVDIDAYDNQGNTALMKASGMSSEVVKLLIDKGANFYLKNSRGMNAFKIELYNRDTECAELIRKAAAKRDNK